MTYEEARAALNEGHTVTVRSERDRGFTGTVKAMNIMFGLDHVTIEDSDGKRVTHPIADVVKIDAVPETIDLTPTWEQTARMMCVLMRDGTEQGKRDAEAEIMKMGKLLDQLIEERELEHQHGVGGHV